VYVADQVRVYSAGQHRFFDDLYNMLVCYIAFGSAAQAYNGGDPTFAGLDRVGLGGRACGVELLVRPSTILPPILEDRRPDRIELIELPFAIDWSTVPGSRGRQEPRRVLTPVIHAAFVHYYESVLDEIECNHGPSRTWHQWPEVLRFGRTVRNAFTHGGVVHVTDPKAPVSSWQGVTYGPAQNGHQVLYTDLMPGDLVLLMEEMDQTV
jgi:hypothetical protein